MNQSMLHLDEHLNVSSGGSTDNLAKSFFAKLPHKLILELYELYKLDFEFFDYDYKLFLWWILCIISRPGICVTQ